MKAHSSCQTVVKSNTKVTVLSPLPKMQRRTALFSSPRLKLMWRQASSRNISDVRVRQSPKICPHPPVAISAGPEQIARCFGVSTDFLLGETAVTDRKNYEIVELGLSAQAARNLYTGRVCADVVNRLLESPRFVELTFQLQRYFTGELAQGYAAHNQMLSTLSSAFLSGTENKTPPGRRRRRSGEASFRFIRRI